MCIRDRIRTANPAETAYRSGPRSPTWRSTTSPNEKVMYAATRSHDGETKTGMPNGRPSDSPLPHVGGRDGVAPVMLTMLRVLCVGGRQAEYPHSALPRGFCRRTEETLMVGAMTTTADHPV